MSQLLDGKRIASELRSEIQRQVHDWVLSGKPIPHLAAILVGDDPASQVYVKNKEMACEKAGIKSTIYRLPTTTNENELLERIARLNREKSVHGILVQLPLPSTISSQKVLDSISPQKDVDAFHPENVGLLSQGRPRFLPCTPHGVQQILAREKLSTAGKHVVILGRSEIVGKPLALMLAQKDSPFGPEYANATVTICHSRSQQLQQITRQADILIAAIGKPEFVSAEFVRAGAVVIDVGINRIESRLVGDVEFHSVSKIASAITPVPGGVGPLTIAMLLHNTFAACRLQNGAEIC